MTGFGKVTAELPSKKVTVEIKALNSKQLDLSTRIPSIYKDKEMELRSLLLQSLERGKVEFNIFIEYIGKDTPTQINLAAVENYYNQIKEIAEKLNISVPNDWFQTLLRMPDGAFASEYGSWIAHSRIDAWIYGHSHSNIDTKIGSTRVICNQMGYVFANEHLVNGFNPEKYVEI